MIKKLLLSAAFVGCLTNAAHAMDGGERAREMALYQSQINGGAQITTTTTTAPVPMPMPATPMTVTATAPAAQPYMPSHALPPGAPTITASKTAVSRSLPDNGDSAMTTTTTQQTTTTTMAPALAPMIPAAPAMSANAAPTPVAGMSPLNDDGTPMHVRPVVASIGQTRTSASKYEAVVSPTAGGSADASSDHDRQMQAWQQWQSANNGAGAATPAPAPMIRQQKTTTTVTTTATTPMVAPAATTTTTTTTPTASDVTPAASLPVDDAPAPAAPAVGQ